MESRAPSPAPTQVEAQVLDRAVGGRGEAVDDRVIRRGPDRRHLLLPALHALQDAVGWISPEALAELCARLHVPRAEAFGVATFYALLRTEQGPATLVHVCDDIACRIHPDAPSVAPHAAGGEGIGVHASPCLGQCDRAPATFVQRSGGAAGPLDRHRRCCRGARSGGFAAGAAARHRSRSRLADRAHRSSGSGQPRGVPGSRRVPGVADRPGDGTRGGAPRDRRLGAAGQGRGRLPDRREVAGGRRLGAPRPLRRVQRG